jgi:hypothetical protein
MLPVSVDDPSVGYLDEAHGACGVAGVVVRFEINGNKMHDDLPPAENEQRESDQASDRKAENLRIVAIALRAPVLLDSFCGRRFERQRRWREYAARVRCHLQNG